jgi:crotonobetainyl-CoA:carnitine CoA-transferase CaiB-like acyl-CoA transferase
MAPGVGEHSLEILKSIGYSKDEIDDLIQEGIVTSQ